MELPCSGLETLGAWERGTSCRTYVGYGISISLFHYCSMLCLGVANSMNFMMRKAAHLFVGKKKVLFDRLIRLTRGLSISLHEIMFEISIQILLLSIHSGSLALDLALRIEL